MRKEMEGDDEQRRAQARETREEGKRPSEAGGTTGASKQRDHEPRRAERHERDRGS